MGFTNKTNFLGLPQWLGNEYLQRVDMNNAFADVETFARGVAFADLAMAAVLLNTGYSCKVSNGTYTEIVGNSATDYKLCRVSMKTDNGWQVTVDGFGLTRTLTYTKSGNDWNMEVNS